MSEMACVAISDMSSRWKKFEIQRYLPSVYQITVYNDLLHFEYFCKDTSDVGLFLVYVFRRRFESFFSTQYFYVPGVFVLIDYSPFFSLFPFRRCREKFPANHDQNNLRAHASKQFVIRSDFCTFLVILQRNAPTCDFFFRPTRL
jgi:hypothetical protein